MYSGKREANHERRCSGLCKKGQGSAAQRSTINCCNGGLAAAVTAVTTILHYIFAFGFAASSTGVSFIASPMLPPILSFLIMNACCALILPITSLAKLSSLMVSVRSGCRER